MAEPHGAFPWRGSCEECMQMREGLAILAEHSCNKAPRYTQLPFYTASQPPLDMLNKALFGGRSTQDYMRKIL